MIGLARALHQAEKSSCNDRVRVVVINMFRLSETCFCQHNTMSREYIP